MLGRQADCWEQQLLLDVRMEIQQIQHTHDAVFRAPDFGVGPITDN